MSGVGLLEPLEETIEQLFPQAEIRGSKFFQRLSKIDQVPASGQIEDSERSRYLETLSSRGRGPSAVVDENQVGRERNAEQYCRLLARVQRSQGRIVAGLNF